MLEVNMDVEVLFKEIFCLDLTCTMIRFFLTIIAAYSSFQVIFSRIATIDDLLMYFKEIEYPKNDFAKEFRKFREKFMLRYIFTTALTATALLAIQYPENSYIPNATAIFYGLLGPWFIRDQIKSLIKEKMQMSFKKEIISTKPNVSETADEYLKGVFKEFENSKK
jgi:hypothetical protein